MDGDLGSARYDTAVPHHFSNPSILLRICAQFGKNHDWNGEPDEPCVKPVDFSSSPDRQNNMARWQQSMSENLFTASYRSGRRTVTRGKAHNGVMMSPLMAARDTRRNRSLENGRHVADKLVCAFQPPKRNMSSRSTSESPTKPTARQASPSSRKSEPRTKTPPKLNSPRERVNFDFQARLVALKKLNSYVVKREEYTKAVAEVIDLMSKNNMTLNHISDLVTLEDFEKDGALQAPALQFQLGREITYLDEDDICKGIGYYLFSRISAGTMTDAPNFNLDNEHSVMYFIDPRVLLKHHFIVCKGNVAKSAIENSPGRFHSKMRKEEALAEALRAVKKLKEMIQAGVDKIPVRNELAIFQHIESDFVYPHLCVANTSNLRSRRSKYVESVFSVGPTTRRFEAGKEAMRRKVASETANVSLSADPVLPSKALN